MPRLVAFLVFVGLGACAVLVPLDGLTGGETVDTGSDVGVAQSGRVPDAADVRLPDAATDGDGASPGADYRAAVLADRPIGYWRFEELSGRVAKDELGLHDGTYLDEPTLGASGVIPETRAVEFPSGGIARVDIPGDVFRFAGGAPFTIEVWAKPRVFKNYQWLGGTDAVVGGARSGWALTVNDAGLARYESFVPPATLIRGLVQDTQPLTIGVFQHLVWTFDGTVGRVYVNAAFRGEETWTSSATNSGNLVMGCLRQDGTFAHCLDGWTLDELAIYDVQLTRARLQVHVDLGKL
jgi:hypothetical protein